MKPEESLPKSNKGDDPTFPYHEGGRDFDAEDEARQNLANKYNL